ncbi:MAG TPA: GtrA family protein [Microbacteriaceae bacterium]|nr:GtrA family protein [Microbacteriaceae bacterium]
MLEVKMRRLKSASRYIWDRIARYALKFGVVGGFGYVIDLSISNALWAYGLSTGNSSWVFSPVGGKMISTSVAILFNWVGNRYWVFRAHRRRDVLKELLEFVAVSVGGMFIALAVLWFTHHVLGYHSLLANNIAGNVVGLGLGTIFRFLLYRYWVYGNHRFEQIEGAQDESELAELALFVEPTATGSVPARFRKDSR